MQVVRSSSSSSSTVCPPQLTLLPYRYARHDANKLSDHFPVSSLASVFVEVKDTKCEQMLRKQLKHTYGSVLLLLLASSLSFSLSTLFALSNKHYLFYLVLLTYLLLQHYLFYYHYYNYRYQLGAGINVKIKNDEGQTALHLAAIGLKHDQLTTLIQQGAALEAQDTKGCTPLIAAAKAGSPECVEALLSAGADANAASHGGDTALMWAAIKGHNKCARLLCSSGGADVNARNSYGQVRTIPSSLSLSLFACLN